LITALFCDLVGSTELGERLDAELLRKLQDRYFDAMRAAIQRHGGTVEKFIGDAVVGAFGVQEAHEDDALRAVRAALEMREAAAELDREIDDPEIRILVRIAIDCGEAFADEAAATQGRIGGACSTRLHGYRRPPSRETYWSPRLPSGCSAGAWIWCLWRRSSCRERPNRSMPTRSWRFVCCRPGSRRRWWGANAP